MCMLAFTSKTARIKQAMVEHKIPTKKKYSSTISFFVKTLNRIRKIIIQLMSKGISRSLVVLRYMEFTLLIVFKRKKSKMGKIIVSIEIEKSFAVIMASGINLGVLEK